MKIGTQATTPAAVRGRESRRQLVAAAAIVVAGVVAYHGTWHVPFIFDDLPAIVDNPTIRHAGEALFPPDDSGVTVNGRPLVNLSLAFNYAMGGTSVVGYHAVNLAIHIAAALLLYGIVRRTLLLPAGGARTAGAAQWLAAAAAGLWLLHPLQTEAVTYIVQRAESLMGLCYLLTLYGFIRGATEGGRAWFAVAVAAGFAGMATKEVMISAPVVVLAFDRTFLAGSFREAWRRRGGWYLGLAAGWLLLAAVMVRAGDRGGSAGFGLGVTWWECALTQVQAVTHYLRLAFWPDPLVLDYQMPVVRTWTAVAGRGALLLGLAAAGAAGFRRGRWWGFLALAFLAILAPSSSVVPLADTMFEHRMYLPLAALVIAFVIAVDGLHSRAGRWLFPVLAVACAVLTVRRNADYRSEETIWRDTVAKRPENARAHYTLGSILLDSGQGAEAIAADQRAVALAPDSAPAHVALANALARTGETAEAIAHYERALALAPDLADAHTNLGNVLAQSGRFADAALHLERAVHLRPNSPEARNNLGNILARESRLTEARAQWQEAVRLRPEFPEALVNLGNLAAQAGDFAEAVRKYEAALRVRPDFVEAHYNLGTALAMSGRLPEAVAAFEATLKLQPDHAGARKNLEAVRQAAERAAANGN